MGCMKRYFEEHFDEFSNEELLSLGYSEEDIQYFRELLSNNKKEES